MHCSFGPGTTFRDQSLLLQTYANVEERSPKDAYYMPAQADRWAITCMPLPQPSKRAQVTATGIAMTHEVPRQSWQWVRAVRSSMQQAVPNMGSPEKLTRVLADVSV